MNCKTSSGTERKNGRERSAPLRRGRCQKIGNQEACKAKIHHLQKYTWYGRSTFRIITRSAHHPLRLYKVSHQSNGMPWLSRIENIGNWLHWDFEKPTLYLDDKDRRSHWLVESQPETTSINPAQTGFQPVFEVNALDEHDQPDLRGSLCDPILLQCSRLFYSILCTRLGRFAPRVRFTW